MRTDVDMPPLVSKTCWSCCFYGDQFCEVFEVEVDSEIYAARDCEEYIRKETA
jgi:hypothetical protein